MARPSRRLVLSLLFLLPGLLGYGLRPAAAHPHVFVTDSVTFVFDKAGRVTALRLDWLFDDLFSFGLLEDFDANGDGSFDEAEVAALHDGAFASLRDYGWFAHLYLDGAPPACRTSVSEDSAHAYYFDLVYPQMIRLDCGTS